MLNDTLLGHKNLLMRNTILTRTMVEVLAQLTISQMHLQVEGTNGFSEIYMEKFTKKIVSLYEKRVKDI